MRTLSGQFRSIKCPNPNRRTPAKSEVKFNTNPKSESCLKQHNGELKGGAKASRAGRPWICACIICGFTDRSEASVFESKWKGFSRRVPRKNLNDNLSQQSEDPSLPLLRHRQAALNRVKGSLDCTHLEINWHLDPL